MFVKQHDGTYASTPFYVKFGKLGVLRAKQKIVYIKINGLELNKFMFLNDSGIATFALPPDSTAKDQMQQYSRTENCAAHQSDVETSSQERLELNMNIQTLHAFDVCIHIHMCIFLSLLSIFQQSNVKG